MHPRSWAWLALGLTLCIAGRRGVAEDAPAATPPGRPAAKGDALLGELSLGSSKEPIEVTSDSLEFDNRTRILTYKGGVVAIQGDMKLESKVLTVALDEHLDNRLKEIVATGDVRLSKGTRWATAGRAVFDQLQRTVTLSESAVLHDGSNQVSGERVLVYLDEQRSVVEGGNGRVKAVLYPPQGGADGESHADSGHHVESR